MRRGTCTCTRTRSRAFVNKAFFRAYYEVGSLSRVVFSYATERADHKKPPFFTWMPLNILPCGCLYPFFTVVFRFMCFIILSISCYKKYDFIDEILFQRNLTEWFNISTVFKVIYSHKLVRHVVSYVSLFNLIRYVKILLYAF